MINNVRIVHGRETVAYLKVAVVSRVGYLGKREVVGEQGQADSLERIQLKS